MLFVVRVVALLNDDALGGRHDGVVHRAHVARVLMLMLMVALSVDHVGVAVPVLVPVAVGRLLVSRTLQRSSKNDKNKRGV